MDLTIFVVFLVASLVSAGLGIAKRNFFFFVLSGMMFLFLGTVLVAEGLSVTYSGAFGICCNDTSISGIETKLVTFSDLWIKGFGFMFWILGLYLIISALLPTGDSTPKGRKL